jgi:hypothetical protein
MMKAVAAKRKAVGLVTYPATGVHVVESCAGQARERDHAAGEIAEVLKLLDS